MAASLMMPNGGAFMPTAQGGMPNGQNGPSFLQQLWGNRGGGMPSAGGADQPAMPPRPTMPQGGMLTGAGGQMPQRPPMGAFSGGPPGGGGQMPPQQPQQPQSQQPNPGTMRGAFMPSNPNQQLEQTPMAQGQQYVDPFTHASQGFTSVGNSQQLQPNGPQAPYTPPPSPIQQLMQDLTGRGDNAGGQ